MYLQGQMEIVQSCAAVGGNPAADTQQIGGKSMEARVRVPMLRTCCAVQDSHSSPVHRCSKRPTPHPPRNAEKLK